MPKTHCTTVAIPNM